MGIKAERRKSDKGREFLNNAHYRYFTGGGARMSERSSMEEKIEALRRRKMEIESEFNKSLAELEKQKEMDEQVKANVAGTERVLEEDMSEEEGENELDCRKVKVGRVDVEDDIKNKGGKISFNELVRVVIERTSSNKEGKVRFTTGDMAEVSRVMHEIMSRYAELEKKFVQKAVDFEKMEENFIWAKNYQEQEKVRFTRELARMQRKLI